VHGVDCHPSQRPFVRFRIVIHGGAVPVIDAQSGQHVAEHDQGGDGGDSAVTVTAGGGAGGGATGTVLLGFGTGSTCFE
jgi:hypothetical protein